MTIVSKIVCMYINIQGISFARGNVTADKLVGIGSCPEGINQNSVMFEFLHEASLQLGQVNVTNW